MRVLRPIVSVVTALAFFVQATGLAYAAPPQADVQPVPYNPSQPIPVPAQPAYPAAPAPVPAPSPGYTQAGAGGDSVYLKGGGMMRGTLVEMLPNDHATLQLPSGQNAIIEWGKIDHIERAAPTVGPLAPPVSGGFAPPPRRPRFEGGNRGSAVVHLDADPGVVLESISPGSGRWALVCAAPCDAAVPLGRQYRIAGEGIRPSRAFGIEAAPGGHAEISVSAATKGGFQGGIALSSVGAGAIIVGLTVVFVGALGACGDGDFGTCDGPANGGLETAGAIISLAGVALLVGGIILTVSNARTKATQTVGDIVPPAPSRPETAWLRAPIWHDSVRDSSTGQPKSTGVPLLSYSF
jgi:hypothetical protein